MRMSVVMRSKDEADRLRLALASLARQTMPAEVIVVNDGSSDHTPEVLAEAAREMPLQVITHAQARGRSAASNAGARAARGDVVVFIDGDTLAGPEYVERHARVHATGALHVGRGERFHLRSTRFLRNPETGTPQPGEEERLARMSADERTRLTVSRAEVVGNFAAIDRRAERGIYPGSGPRRLDELEIDALQHHPDCDVLWVAASGSNLSVPREAFLDHGGFDEAIEINEHREFSYRLHKAGATMAFAAGARDYHLTHRRGWRDPLQDTRWEELFYAAHPQLVVKLLAVFWMSLGSSHRIPEEARILSLPELARAARGDSGIDYDAVRRMIGGLPELPPPSPGHARDPVPVPNP